MKKFLCFTFLVLSIFVRAQNLVPNPSFEEYNLCPDEVSEFRYVKYWFQPTPGTTDYYNSCDTIRFGNGMIEAGVPDNLFGHQIPHSGGGYAGIALEPELKAMKNMFIESTLKSSCNNPYSLVNTT